MWSFIQRRIFQRKIRKFEASHNVENVNKYIQVFLIFLSRKLEYFVVNNKYIKVCVSDSLIYLFCRIEY